MDVLFLNVPSRKHKMDIAKIEHYIKEITAHEFDERNSDIQLVVTDIQQIMAGRGLLRSTGTLSKIATFFEEEFKYRNEYIKDLILGALPKIDRKEKSDVIGKMKELYQKLSFSEKDSLLSSYEYHARQTYEPTNQQMSKDLISRLESASKKLLEKNNTIIHYEYDTVVNTPQNNKIIFVKPNFMGIGLDVMALYEKLKINL